MGNVLRTEISGKISINHAELAINIEIINAAIFHFIIFVSSIFNLSTLL